MISNLLKPGFVLATLLATLPLVGCSSTGSKSEADAMKKKDPFESAEEPAINADTHFAAGQLAEAQGNLDNAEKQYLQSLEQDPRNTKSLYSLGVLYVRTKRNDEAIDTFKRYVDATDQSVVAYANLGLAYKVAGKFDEASDAFEAGIKKDPKNVLCRVNYGLMLAHRNKIAEATLQFQAVLTPAEVHYNLGAAYEDLNRLEAAREEYELALKANPKFKDARVRLAALK